MAGRFGSFVALLALFAPPVAAAAADATVAVLENGMKVGLMENHGSEMIASTAIVGAGADWETAATAGSSHMLEHLLFNGTARRTQKELYDDTDFYGIYSNATTRRSHTVYFVLVSKDHIAEALDIQEDMLFHSILPEDKFEKERGIVIEEIGKDEQNPAVIADRLFRAAAFRGSPYGREVLGSRETIRALSRETVLEYYHATYVPDNMTLLVAGDFDTDAMLDLVRERFGANNGRSASPVPPAAPPLPPSPGETIVHHGVVDKGYLSIALTAPAIGSEGSLLFPVIADLLADRLNERFVLARDVELFSVECSYERRKTFGRLLVSCTFDPSRDAKKIVAEVLEETRRFADEGVDADHFTRKMVSRKTGDIYLSEKLHYYGMMMAEEYALIGQEGLDETRRLLDAIDAGGVSAEAKKRIRTDRWFAAILLPGPADYDDEDFAVHVPGETNGWETAGRTGESTGGFRVIRRARRPGGEGGDAGHAGSVLDTTLSNGLRILVDSNDDSEVFAVHLLLKNRSWQEPEGKAGIADFLHRLLPRRGGGKDAAELRVALDRIGAELKVSDAAYIPYDDYYTTPDFSFIRFTTIDEFIDPGLDILADLVIRPDLAPEDVETVREEKLAIARGKEETPSDLSRALFYRLVYGDHPLAAPPEGTPTTIRGITADEIASFHKLYMASDNMIISVVTSLDGRRVVSALAERFGGMEKMGKRKPPPPPIPLTVRDSLVAVDHGASQAYIRTGYTTIVSPEERPALQVAVALLSGDLAFDLRETRGLAYSIGAGVFYRKERATVVAAMGTAPDNVDDALGAIREHLDTYAKLDSIHERAVERTVNSLIGRDLMRRLSRPNQAFRLGMSAFRGETGSDPVEALRAVTREDVLRAARKYIRSMPARTVLVR